jgi:hypothetical protein
MVMDLMGLSIRIWIWGFGYGDLARWTCYGGFGWNNPYGYNNFMVVKDITETTPTWSKRFN